MTAERDRLAALLHVGHRPGIFDDGCIAEADRLIAAGVHLDEQTFSYPPDHALHFDPDCEECAYLARPTRATLDLDVERLARALDAWWMTGTGQMPITGINARRAAEWVAAAYRADEG